MSSIKKFLTLSLLWILFVSTLGVFEMVQVQIRSQNNLWNAGQLTVSMPDKWPSHWPDAPASLSRSMSVYTNSAVLANGQWKAIDIQAIDTSYPLVGELLFSDGKSEIALGDVYLSYDLKTIFPVGERVQIGDAQLIVKGYISKQDELSGMKYLMNSKVMMSLDSFYTTKLWVPGSRVTINYFFSGNPDEIKRFENQLAKVASDHITIKSPSNPDTWGSIGVDRISKWQEQMMGIIWLVTLIALWIYGQSIRQNALESAKVLSGFGISRLKTCWYFVSREFFWLLVVVISWLLVSNFVIDHLSLFGVEVEIKQGFLELAMIALSLTTIGALSLFWVLSEHLIYRSFLGTIGILISLYAFLHYADDPFNALEQVVKQTVIIALVLAGVYLLLNVIVARMSRMGAYGLVVANNIRFSQHFYTLLVALMVTFISSYILINHSLGSLINRWEVQVPDKTPNIFLINITKEDLPNLSAKLPSDTHVYPVVRARITQVNNKDVFQHQPSLQYDPSFNRELNMTYQDSLPRHNNVSEGKWRLGLSGASLEEGFAKRANIKLGDVITVSIFGQLIQVEVIAMRQVKWQSMQPNFFVITTPDVLSSYPATWMTSFYWPSSQINSLYDQLALFPSITVYSIDQIVQQVKGWLETLKQLANIYSLISFGLVALIISNLLSAHIERLGVFRKVVFSALVPRHVILKTELIQTFVYMMLGYFLTALCVLGVEWLVSGIVSMSFANIVLYSLIFYLLFIVLLSGYIYRGVRRLGA